MKMFAAAVITSCIYICSFHVPIEAQVAPGPGVIDVHMHAMKPEDFAGPPISANFGAFRKTYQTSERDPEALADVPSHLPIAGKIGSLKKCLLI
jgi:hypothetical protein